MKTNKIILILNIVLLFSQILSTGSIAGHEPSIYYPDADSISIDGVIGAGEYDYSETLDVGTSFIMHYSIVNDEIFMGIEATADGWISVGWGDPASVTSMDEMDYFIGYVSGGVATIEDWIGTSRYGHVSDLSNGGTDDFLASAGTESGGTTILEIQRNLDTGDSSCDTPIVAGEGLYLQWAISASDDFSIVHSERDWYPTREGLFTFQLPPASEPDAPSNLSATPADGQISLSWDAPGDGGDPITTYTVKRGTSTGSYIDTFDAGLSTTYVDSSVTNGQEYFYVVSATNGIGESTNSAEISSTPGAVPEAPGSFMATGELNQISLSWDAAVSDSPITGYTVRRGTGTGTYTTDLDAGTDTTYADTTVTNGITYYYTVYATSAIGNGAEATETSAVAFGVPAAPVPDFTISQSVDLFWDEPNTGGSPITEYKIYRGISSGDTSYLDSTTDLSYSDSSIIKGLTYYYQVSAVNVHGESDLSSELMVTLISPPAAPTDLSVVLADAQITLNWLAPTDDGGSDITDYLVYRSSTTGGPYAFIGNSAGALLYVDVGLTNGQDYYYVVRAVTNIGVSVDSAEQYAMPVSVPTAPQNPSASGTSGAISLSWYAPLSDSGSAIISYEIQRSTTSGSGYAVVGSTTGLSYVDSTVADNTQYYYIIVAVNTEGSMASSEVSATPAATPSEPLSLGTSTDGENITISWDIPSSDGGYGIDSYKVYRSLSSGGSYVLRAITTDLSYKDYSVDTGVSYYYVISAVNSMGESSYSSEVYFSIATVADAPSSLSGTYDGSINLTWTAPADGGSAITDYMIKRGTRSGYYTETFSAGNSDTTYSDSDVSKGNTYYYVVVAINVEGESAVSNEYSYTIGATSPSTPYNVDALLYNNQVNVTWDCDDGGLLTTYTVDYRQGAGPWTFLTTTTEKFVIDTTHTTPGIQLQYRVSASNALGSTIPGVMSLTWLYGPPSPATSFTGDNTAALSWTASAYDGGDSDITYYIYRSQTMGSGYISIGSTGSTSYADSSAVSGESYYYVILAENNYGVSEYSSEIHLTIASVPSVPQSPTITVGSSSLLIEWTAPSSDGGSSITNYTVYRSLHADYGYSMIATAYTESYNDTSVTHGETYYYIITAWNDNGESQYATVVSDTVPTTVPEAPDLDLQPADGQIALTWVDNSDGGSAIIGYKIYRSEISGSYTTVLVSLGLVYSYTDDTVTNGVEYFYMIVSNNTNGYSDNSTEHSAVPSAIPTDPTNLLLTEGTGQITLDWDASTSNSSMFYEIYRDSGVGFRCIDTSASNSYIDEDIFDGDSYDYYVVAVNPSGSSSASNTESISLGSAPSEPQNLAVVAGSSSITLSWDEPSSGPAMEYKIYRSTIQGGPYSQVGSSLNLGFTDTSAALGITYYYVVSAYDLGGESAHSNEDSAILAGIPTAPVGLNTSMVYDTISLDWTVPVSDGGSSITEYVIYRSTSVDTGYAEIARTGGSTLTYDDIVSTLGIQYFYYVVAVNAEGVSGASLIASGLPGGVPDQVANLIITEGNSQLLLEWDAPFDGGFDVDYYYEVYRYNSDSASFEYLSKVYTTSYVDSELVNGISYEYHVLAHNVLGRGTASVSTTGIPVTVSTAPLHLNIDFGNTQLVLNWDAPLDTGGSSVTSYNIYRAEVADGSYDLVGNSTNTNFTDTGLTNGMKYFYKVTAVTDVGESLYSEYNSSIPMTFPEAVSNLQISADAAEVTLTWIPGFNGGSNITHYHVERALSEDGTYVSVANVTETSYSETVEYGVEYFYKVCSDNIVGHGVMSTVISIRPVAVPDAPTNLEAVAGNTAISLSWIAPSANGEEIVHYLIYRQTVDSTIMELLGNSTIVSFVDTELEGGVSYVYCVSAVNSIGEGKLSDTITIDSPLEISDNPLPSDTNDLGNETTDLGTESNITSLVRSDGFKVFIGVTSGLIIVFIGTSVVLIRKRVL